MCVNDKDLWNKTQAIHLKTSFRNAHLRVASTYWQRFGWWHYSSVAQTPWVTPQGDTANRSEDKDSELVSYKRLMLWAHIKSLSGQDSPWQQLCTCQPPFSQTLVSQRCWWLRSWTPFPEPPVKAMWQMWFLCVDTKREWKQWNEVCPNLKDVQRALCEDGAKGGRQTELY